MSKTSAATKRFMNEKLQGKDVYTEPNSAHSDQELLERKLRFSSQVVQDLSFWVPHVGQAPIGKALFYDEKKDVIVECGRKYGKCLNLLEFLETPSGKRQLKDIKTGDIVFGSDGKPCSVVFVSEVHTNNECYEVTFSDGTSTIADADHKWIIYDWRYKKLIKTTEEVLKKFKGTTNEWQKIPLCSPVEYPHKNVPVEPYTLGAWIGDGTSSSSEICVYDEEIINRIMADGYEVSRGKTEKQKHVYYIRSGVYRKIKDMGLIGNKHIPVDYIHNSVEVRLELIRGIFDTDGWVSTNNGKCYFAQKNQSTFFSVVEILRSLGMSVTITKDKEVNGQIYKVLYTPANMQIFNLSRKAERLAPHLLKDRRKFKRITSIKKADKVPVKCIGVDSSDNSYLINGFTVTHNSELAPYCQYRWAITHNDSYNYYFVPMKDQIGDIIWSNGRMPEFLPIHLKRKYLDGDPSKSEYRVNFKNGSFIRCDGSDSHQKARGYSANGLTVYDETKDFHPMFHDAFDPNRAINDAPLLALGTPGDEKALLTKLFDAAQTSSYGAAFNFPSYVNPHISKEFLAKKEKEYRERGEYDLFQIEYLAKRIKLGSKYIFPMLKRAFIKPHAELLKHVNQNRRDYDFCVSYDPGSSKCFAVLLLAIHRFERHVIILDEIYATKLGENSTRKIVPVALFKAEEINPVNEDWMDCYDYAAAWFHSDIVDQFEDYPHALFPCEKDIKDKEAKLNLIKDMLNANLISVSDRCTSFYKEMDEYKLNDKGILKKENDHLIDAFRYALNVLSYDTIEAARPLEFKDKYKTGTPELDLLRSKKEGDFYGDIDGDLFY